MRQIFRIYDRANNKYIEDIENYLLFSNGDIAYYYRHSMLITDLAPRNFFIERYTGLKDKNGKKIFEGDIVKYWYIPYNCGGLGSEWKSKLINWCDDRQGYNIPKDCIIIGNIHDNKELLEKK